jgi:hypothetical protein
MNQIVTSVGIEIPADIDFVDLDSTTSLSNSDIVVFCPSYNEVNYSHDLDGYEGKSLYNKDSSAKILEHTEHWRNELNNFLQNGKTVFIILSEKNDFFIYSGTKTFTGTGRNQKTTYHVQPYSNYNCLPFKYEFISIKGKQVYPCHHLVNNFYKVFKDILEFQTYISSDGLTNSLFTTKNRDRVLGISVRIGSGFAIFLPNINFNQSDLVDYDGTTDEEAWTKKAFRIGKQFVNNLIEIDKAIRKDESKTPTPNWANSKDFSLREANETRKKIELNKENIESINKDIEHLRVLLIEQEKLKDLLFETGKPLENAVTLGLIILGYKAENYNDGHLELDQVIISPENIRYIGECEGKDNKDIDISKFRQLQDSLNEDFEREEVKEKAFGLIFGNPKRFIPPKDRGIGFTTKCIEGAKREKIGLIRTPDLFNVCKYLLETNDDIFKEQCRKAIYVQLGDVIKFPEK